MFLTTVDQDYLYSILDQTGCLRLDQAVRLLRLLDKHKGEAYAVRVLRQLQYMQKACWETDKLISLPHLSGKPVDRDMLAAVDVMLDLSGSKLLAVSAHKPPFKLCFLTEMAEKIGIYAVMLIPRGSETKANFLLQMAVADQRTVIVLLDDLSQRARINITLPHFFALRDAGKYRYFKGNA